MSNIYSNLLKLGEEKRDRIIKSGLREFGRFGYKKTSMEQVAKGAYISKAMLFHYFGTKVQLYNFLGEYCYKFLCHYFGDLDVQFKGRDFLERYELAVKIKLNAYNNNPQVFEFLTMLYMHEENREISTQVKSVFSKIVTLKLESFTLESDVESDREFRQDIDVMKAKKYISWIIEGYTQSVLALVKEKALIDADINGEWEEFNKILEDLRKLFYK